jgi:hypothetical protein
MYKTIKKCRACGFYNLTPVFDLGVQPLANDLRMPDESSSGYAPLKVLFCPMCTLGQLSVAVDPNVLYSNYPYVTSKSGTMREHFVALWRLIQAESRPACVVEIGSNDGDFLRFCLTNGADTAIGIDPAENLTPEATENLIPICSLFGQSAAEKAASLAASRGGVNAIVARHVFAHIDDWSGFFRSLSTLASIDTTIFIEVPYAVDMLERSEFDTVYHEHLSYVTVKSVEEALKDTDFYLHRVERFEIHGGAVVLVIKHIVQYGEEHPTMLAIRKSELVTVSKWEAFSRSSHAKLQAMKHTVGAISGEGITVAGFGASAKSAVWINACQFTQKEIPYILDCTPQKQGRLSPGSRIPVLPESRLLELMPNYAIMFAWNFRSEIINKNTEYTSRGGKFIIPRTGIEIYPQDP